ncbi:cupin (plasmid) [Rhizobium leguminosarum bv. trifolii WSM1689]|uniref:Cupin domain-containing protein n=1 Tax=Rhizobium aouanii TaxID=3118145 RepID=A0ABU8CPR9_9HYPH|nr:MULTISPECIES: cupin domain-containing protein [Rhizobium]AHF88594.1 cupin [Rhizobium leguminosarum bv. trifolii WSM1689]MBY3327149.1 cupin domain-containing protein [Rhizobium laguerreae]MBY5740861.1 cupin domain-containing protein [Rhizobium leguminosarum]
MSDTDVIFRKAGGEFMPTTWGELNWKITGDDTPGAEMTFGTCRINPGERNQLHSHPDCEEILYVVSGHCEHKLGDALYRLEAGDAIRIPRNVRHWARALGTEPLFALIMFSSGTRTAVNHEGEGTA